MRAARSAPSGRGAPDVWRRWRRWGLISALAAVVCAGVAIGAVAVVPSPTPPSPPGPVPTGPTPGPADTIDLAVGGTTFKVPASVAQSPIDLGALQLVAQGVNGRSYVTAPSRIAGATCFLEIDQQGGASIVGCDDRRALVRKGGWLIFHPTGAGTRSGVLVLPEGETASGARAGGRPLEVSGRGVVFRDLPDGVAGIDVTTERGTRTQTFPGE